MPKINKKTKNYFSPFALLIFLIRFWIPELPPATINPVNILSSNGSTFTPNNEKIHILEETQTETDTMIDNTTFKLTLLYKNIV